MSLGRDRVARSRQPWLTKTPSVMSSMAAQGQDNLKILIPIFILSVDKGEIKLAWVGYSVICKTKPCIYEKLK